MSDDELNAKFDEVKREVRDLWLAAIVLLVYLTVLIIAARPAHAASTPKATPSPTQTLCVNVRTNVVRDILSNNSAGCHKNEVEVSIDTLLATQATPAPTATPSGAPTPTASPTPTPVPDPTATPTQSACDYGCVMDANSKIVGPLYPVGADAQQQTEVLMSINGVAMSLPVSDGGFVTGPQVNVQFSRWYPTTDCTGQSYIVVAGDGNGNVDVQPLVEVASVQRGPYIYGTTVWYAQPPWSNITMNSVQAYIDPTGAPTSSCQSAQDVPNLGTWLAGPPASFNLSNLGFVTPFEGQE